MEFAKILKANPYHDETGRFSSEGKASFVSTGGVFDKQRAKSTKVKMVEGTNELASFSGKVSHHTSAENAKKIKENGGVTPTKGMLDVGTYFVDGVGKETSAASTEASVVLNIKKARLLEAKNVKALLDFTKANNLEGMFNESITKLGFDGIRLKEPFTGGKEPWIILYNQKVATVEKSNVKKSAFSY